MPSCLCSFAQMKILALSLSFYFLYKILLIGGPTLIVAYNSSLIYSAIKIELEINGIAVLETLGKGEECIAPCVLHFCPFTNILAQNQKHNPLSLLILYISLFLSRSSSMLVVRLCALTTKPTSQPWRCQAFSDAAFQWHDEYHSYLQSITFFSFSSLFPFPYSSTFLYFFSYLRQVSHVQWHAAYHFVYTLFLLFLYHFLLAFSFEPRH